MSDVTILCVDDDPSLLTSLRTLLGQHLGPGHIIEIAESGQEALDICEDLSAERGELSVVISDFIMPGMHGDELLARIHAVSPNTMTILLTGQSNLDGVKRAINEADLYRFLEKPFINEDILLTVRGANRAYHQARELERQNENLRQLNGNLESLVLQRTESLLEKNEELNQTLTVLRQTQNQLVQAEKMAALGGMVIGISHEINTPVGVCLMAASSFQEEAKYLACLFNEGKMKKSDLADFLESSQTAAQVLVANITRTAGLVKDFKKIAVEHSAEPKVSFNIKTCLSDTLACMAEILQAEAIQCRLDCPDSLEVCSYPQGLSQIVTNLIDNAAAHAYPARQGGWIGISARLDGGWLHLSVNDDGAGMEAEVLAQIFDPFFTTSRTKGRVGLGLNIVYNMVTQKFGGSITCRSNPGKGCAFEIAMQVG